MHCDQKYNNVISNFLLINSAFTLGKFLPTPQPNCNDTLPVNEDAVLDELTLPTKMGTNGK